MLYFKITSKTGKKIYTTKSYWELISKVKHPIIADYEKLVKETIKAPDEVRESRKDKRVHLYYKKYAVLKSRYICVLIKQLNEEGFVVTAYLADTVKKGRIIWRKK